MRHANSFGSAGRARCVKDYRNVVRVAGHHFIRIEIRVGLIVLAADVAQFAIREQLRLGVVAHAARVVIDNQFEARALRKQVKQFVDLFLVLDDCHFDFRVVEYVLHLLRDRVLIQRHGNAAEALRGCKRPVQTRPIVADDGEVHAALETARRKSAGKPAHFIGDLLPGPALPDAQIFFADRNLVAAHAGMLKQQLGKGLGRDRTDCALRQDFPSEFAPVSVATTTLQIDCATTEWYTD